MLLLTCDIISFNYRFTDPLRARIEATTGVPAGNILVSNSHTHSGPLTWGVLSEDQVDAEYMDVLGRKLASIAQMAVAQMRPATVGFARREVRVGYNRRAMAPDEPLRGVPLRGPLAPVVDVMAIRDEAGRFLAAWFCHAAHAVVLGGDNYLLSADYPGPAQAAVEAIHPGCTAMFAQGCCGDINAVRSSPGTFEEVRSRGHLLGGAVIAALEEAGPLEDVTLAAATGRLELPLQARRRRCWRRSLRSCGRRARRPKPPATACRSRSCAGGSGGARRCWNWRARARRTLRDAST